MYKFCDPVAQKVVINMDVVFNEKSMINVFKEEKSQATKSSNNISRSTMQIQSHEFDFQPYQEPHNSDQEHDKQIGPNATKDHLSVMVSRNLFFILYLPIAKIFLLFKKQLTALKMISG